MANHRWGTAEEFERLTGQRGSVYFGPAPTRRPKKKEVFLCPRCYEVLSIPRSDALRVFAREMRLPWSVILLMWWMIWLIAEAALVAFILLFGADFRSQLWAWLEFFVSLVASIFIMWWLIETFINPHAARVIAENAYYDSKGAAASRMLVIRGVDDEASLSLAAGSLGSRLSYFVLTWLIPVAFVMAMIAVFASLVIEPSQKMMDGLALFCFFGALLFFFLTGVFKSAFGREFLIKALVCDIAADWVPDTVEGVTAITFPPVKAPSWLQALRKFSLLQPPAQDLQPSPLCG